MSSVIFAEGRYKTTTNDRDKLMRNGSVFECIQCCHSRFFNLALTRQVELGLIVYESVYLYKNKVVLFVPIG